MPSSSSPVGVPFRNGEDRAGRGGLLVARRITDCSRLPPFLPRQPPGCSRFAGLCHAAEIADAGRGARARHSAPAEIADGAASFAFPVLFFLFLPIFAFLPFTRSSPHQLAQA